MRRLLVFITLFSSLVLGLLAMVPVQAGTISGSVKVLAEPTPSRGPSSPFARRRPVDGHEAHAPTADDRTILVWLEQHPNLPPAPVPSVNPTMNQVDLEIVPGFLAVPVGTTIEFPNSDDVYHNLFSVSSAAKFDLGRYSQGKVKDVTFREPGEVRIFCDIHPHMSAIVIVVPNAYYTEVDDEGHFTLEAVPEGEYNLHAWHEALGQQSKRVSVARDGTTSVTFTFAQN